MTLQIVTREPDLLVRELLQSGDSGPAQDLTVIDISRGSVDYAALVQAIFAATKIQVL